MILDPCFHRARLSKDWLNVTWTKVQSDSEGGGCEEKKQETACNQPHDMCDEHGFDVKWQPIIARPV